MPRRLPQARENGCRGATGLPSAQGETYLPGPTRRYTRLPEAHNAWEIRVARREADAVTEASRQDLRFRTATSAGRIPVLLVCESISSVHRGFQTFFYFSQLLVVFTAIRQWRIIDTKRLPLLA